MSGEYYDHTTFPANGALGLASSMRSELDKIEQGFDKVVPLSGNGNKIVAVKADESGQEALVTTGTGNIVRATDPTFILTDTTTNNASTLHHGWSPKLPGGTSTFYRGDGSFGPQNASSMIVESRSSNTQITAADTSKLLKLTSTFTQTFAAIATLANGFYIFLQNNNPTTGDITLDPNGAELIDGLASFIMYPNEVRLVTSDGTNLTSIVLRPFLRTWTTGGTFVKPPGYTEFFNDLRGGGGSGGGGEGRAAGNIRLGGTGGGGAGRNQKILPASLYSASNVIAIGAGSSGGAGGTNAAGSIGVVGGNTSVGTTIIVAYGGGAGYGATGTNMSGGGGGGSVAAGNAGNGTSSVAGSEPIITMTSDASNNAGNGGAGASQGASAGVVLACAEYGGGGGGGVPIAGNSARVGGSSLYGGCGGGAGGSITAANAGIGGGAGGVIGAYTCGNGGAGGTGSAGNPGATGSATGAGGGGGASNTAGTGGKGGDGGTFGDGGGGGGAGTNTGGAGGAGISGYCTIGGVI